MQGVYISHDVRNPDKLMKENEEVIQRLLKDPHRKKYDQENTCLEVL